MNTAFFISFRYLFSKKSHHAINIISFIAVVGVAVATIAMVCTLSVFNGFHDLLAKVFTDFDPELRISLVEGTTVSVDDPVLKKLRKCPDVAVYTPVLEGQALVVANDHQVVVTLRGVDDNFYRQTDFNKILYGDGAACLHVDVLEYGILGIQLATELGLGTSFTDPIQIYAPKKGERVNMANPLSSFNHDELQSPDVVFMVRQTKYDAGYIICSLGFAQRIFEKEEQVSSIDIKLNPGGSRKNIERLLDKRFVVKDRYEQQEDVFRIMRIEKFISFLFLCLILLVACFNIIGSLSMLMIDKKNDIQTLRHLGASDKLLGRIFMYEGRMICLAGALLGLCIGILLCWIQMQFGVIRMGGTEGSFIVESYPVVVEWTDVLLILVTVVAIGWISVWYPVKRLLA